MALFEAFTAASWWWNATTLEQVLFRPPPFFVKEQHPKWWLRSYPNKETKLTPVLVYYLHGTSETLESVAPVLDRIGRLLSLHSEVVMAAPEYPGYRCNAVTTEASVKSECLATLEMVVRRFPRHRLILVGYSLGGGFATWLAARSHASVCSDSSKVISGYRVEALILVATFRSVADLLQDYRWWVSIQGEWKYVLNNQDLLSALPPRMPVIVLHGGRDVLISQEHAQALYRASVSEHKRLVILAAARHAIEDFVEAIVAAILSTNKTERVLSRGVTEKKSES